eukprot:COSAG01_NODE_12_length_41732_cov_160.472964_34_plen_137_part_00
MLSLRLGLTQSPRCDTQHWTTPVCTAVDCFGGGGGGGQRAARVVAAMVSISVPGETVNRYQRQPAHDGQQDFEARCSSSVWLLCENANGSAKAWAQIQAWQRTGANTAPGAYRAASEVSQISGYHPISYPQVSIAG